MSELHLHLPRVLIVLLLCGQLAFAGSPAREVSESEKLIRAEFDRGKLEGGFLVRQRGIRSSVEVCFDGCDYFEWTGSVHKSSVWDFIVLFENKLGYASTYESFVAASAHIVPSIVARVTKFCLAEATSTRDFDCRWTAYSLDQSLKVGIANYDEGLRCFAWRNLKSLNPPKL
jgi:hypothetical protein